MELKEGLTNGSPYVIKNADITIPSLWQFLLELLMSGSHKEILDWTDVKGEFKLINAEEVAKLWGMRKNRQNMNYDKLSRALRYYYEKNIIKKVAGKKFTYQFVNLPNDVLDEIAVKNPSLVNSNKSCNVPIKTELSDNFDSAILSTNLNTLTQYFKSVTNTDEIKFENFLFKTGLPSFEQARLNSTLLQQNTERISTIDSALVVTAADSSTDNIGTSLASRRLNYSCVTNNNNGGGLVIDNGFSGLLTPCYSLKDLTGFNFDICNNSTEYSEINIKKEIEPFENVDSQCVNQVTIPNCNVNSYQKLPPVFLVTEKVQQNIQNNQNIENNQNFQNIPKNQPFINPSIKIEQTPNYGMVHSRNGLLDQNTTLPFLTADTQNVNLFQNLSFLLPNSIFLSPCVPITNENAPNDSVLTNGSVKPSNVQQNQNFPFFLYITNPNVNNLNFTTPSNLTTQTFQLNGEKKAENDVTIFNNNRTDFRNDEIKNDFISKEFEKLDVNSGKNTDTDKSDVFVIDGNNNELKLTDFRWTYNSNDDNNDNNNNNNTSKIKAGASEDAVYFSDKNLHDDDCSSCNVIKEHKPISNIMNNDNGKPNDTLLPSLLVTSFSENMMSPFDINDVLKYDFKFLNECEKLLLGGKEHIEINCDTVNNNNDISNKNNENNIKNNTNTNNNHNNIKNNNNLNRDVMENNRSNCSGKNRNLKCKRQREPPFSPSPLDIKKKLSNDCPDSIDSCSNSSSLSYENTSNFATTTTKTTTTFHDGNIATTTTSNTVTVNNNLSSAFNSDDNNDLRNDQNFIGNKRIIDKDDNNRDNDDDSSSRDSCLIVPTIKVDGCDGETENDKNRPENSCSNNDDNNNNNSNDFRCGKVSNKNNYTHQSDTSKSSVTPRSLSKLKPNPLTIPKTPPALFGGGGYSVLTLQHGSFSPIGGFNLAAHSDPMDSSNNNSCHQTSNSSRNVLCTPQFFTGNQTFHQLSISTPGLFSIFSGSSSSSSGSSCKNSSNCFSGSITPLDCLHFWTNTFNNAKNNNNAANKSTLTTNTDCQRISSTSSDCFIDDDRSDDTTDSNNNINPSYVNFSNNSNNLTTGSNSSSSSSCDNSSARSGSIRQSKMSIFQFPSITNGASPVLLTNVNLSDCLLTPVFLTTPSTPRI